MKPHSHGLIHILCNHIFDGCVMIVIASTKVHTCEAGIHSQHHNVGIRMGFKIGQAVFVPQLPKELLIECLIKQQLTATRPRCAISTRSVKSNDISNIPEPRQFGNLTAATPDFLFLSEWTRHSASPLSTAVPRMR